MKEKNSNKFLPMFFRLFIPYLDDDGNMIETGVCIDFNKGVIYFINSETPVFYAQQYVRSLPPFFGIKELVIGVNDDLDDFSCNPDNHEN